ncbi:hypothetical protein GY45DRAFT_1371523 [Cubamyces sp. BRFM 1775]|nr:hypothetical protein GY45DRAFT_1371523 [Cubamyces sp. BRFM 1775]
MSSLAFPATASAGQRVIVLVAGDVPHLAASWWTDVAWFRCTLSEGIQSNTPVKHGDSSFGQSCIRGGSECSRRPPEPVHGLAIFKLAPRAAHPTEMSARQPTMARDRRPQRNNGVANGEREQGCGHGRARDRARVAMHQTQSSRPGFLPLFSSLLISGDLLALAPALAAHASVVVVFHVDFAAALVALGSIKHAPRLASLL